MKLNFFRNPDPSSGAAGAATGNSSNPQTDNTKLVTGPTVYVSPDGGTTDEPFPAPNVEYDFCIDVTNGSALPSGPFYVRFSLDNATGAAPQTFDFKQDAGLDAGQSVKAVVHFGSFTNDDTDYTLAACIYSASAPEKPINCAGTFGFNPHMNSVSDPAGSNTGSGN